MNRAIVIITVALVYGLLIPVIILAAYSNAVCDCDNKEAFRRFNGSVTKHDVIVTMSTLPGREDQLRRTLSAWMSQSTPPCKIRVNIPRVLKRTGEEYGPLPDWLVEFQANGVSVSIVDDEGPATKYLSTLRESEDDQWVLVCDDDIVPPLNFLELLMVQAVKFPDAVSSPNGQIVDKDGQYTSYRTAKRHTMMSFWRRIEYITKPTDVQIVEGCEGYLVKPRFLNLKELSDFDNLPDAAFFVDDVVMSGHLAKRGVRRIVQPKCAMMHCPAWELISEVIAPTKSLSNTVNRDRSNDKIMYDHFRQYW